MYAIAGLLLAELSLILVGACVSAKTQYGWQQWVTGRKSSTTRSHRSNRFNIVTAKERKKRAKVTYLGEGRADLGGYSIRIFDPITETILRTDFRLEGRTTCTSEDEFRRFMLGNRRLIREQVMFGMRACDFAELADPDLKLLGKKLASRVNRGVGRRFLESVTITDYEPYESVDKLTYQPIEVAELDAPPPVVTSHLDEPPNSSR